MLRTRGEVLILPEDVVAKISRIWHMFPPPAPRHLRGGGGILAVVPSLSCLLAVT
jgi:hypothetical protein